jgi:hypothetical protein
MNNKLIKEVKRIKELSNINESLITEDVLSDIKKFFEIAPDNMKNTEIVQKLKNFFKNLIPGLDGLNDVTIQDEISPKGQELLKNELFKTKLKEISDAINIGEEYIIKLMNHESGLDPTIKNSIGCVGLIQFCPGGGSTKTVNGKQYSLEDLRNNLEVQLDAIKNFWVKGYNNGKIKSPEDLYIYNFFPIAAGKPDDFVLKSSDLSAETVAKSNPGFNRVLGKPAGTPLTVGGLKDYYQQTGMV